MGFLLLTRTNLPPHISDLDLIVSLNGHFRRVTQVQHVKLVPDPRNNSRCAFIQVESAEEAQKAIGIFDGQDFCGYTLRCELARAHRSLLLSIRHPNELRDLEKIEWVRLRRNRGDRTVHVALGEEAKQEPEADASLWSRRDPLQGGGRLISLENLFNEGREETIRELTEAFGVIEQFGRFVADDRATIYDPHPRPGSWQHDTRDEKGAQTEEGFRSHPRGPWEIKYERRNDSVSAFMALKQIPLFNISRTHTHRPADIGFLASGNVANDSKPWRWTRIFANVPLPADVTVDDRRQAAPTASGAAKNKAKRMRRGAGVTVNALNQPAEDFPPLSKTESKKIPDKEMETGVPEPVGAWKLNKKDSPEVPDVETSGNTTVCKQPLVVAEASIEEPIQQPRHEASKSLEQLIFDSSDSGSVHNIGNVLGLSVNSHKSESRRKVEKPTTCIDISSKIKISGERWDQERFVGVFRAYDGLSGVDYKVKRKPAGSFAAHVEFDTEEQAKAAYEAEKEHSVFGKQMRLVPARRHRGQRPPSVQSKPVPVEPIVPDAEQLFANAAGAGPQDEMEDLSPALSSTLQAESPRPSTSRTDEMEVAKLLEPALSTPPGPPAIFEQPERQDEEVYMDAMVIEVSESTFDGDDDGDDDDDEDDDGDDEKSVGQAKSEDETVEKKAGQEGEGEQEAFLDVGKPSPVRLVTSTSAPGLLFGVGTSELEQLKTTRSPRERPFAHRRALSDSDQPILDGNRDTNTREVTRLPEDVQPALQCLPPTKLPYPPVPEWCDSEIQAASPQPLQQVASSTGSGSEGIPQPNQVSPPTLGQRPPSPVVSSTVSPFGALVYIPPPFDSGSTGTSACHFNSPVPAKGFVETPHGLLPIYPMEVLDRFGRSTPAYSPPQYPILSHPQWSQSQSWQQQQQPDSQWLWGNYYNTNHPYTMPLTPGRTRPAQVAPQQQALVQPQTLHPTGDDEQSGPIAHQHQMSRNNSGGPYGSRRRFSQQRRSQPPVYRDPSPPYNGSQQAPVSPRHSIHSYLMPHDNDNDNHQTHSYNPYQAQPVLPHTTTEVSSSYPANDHQAQPNVYYHSQPSFDQQYLYPSTPFQPQHPPPPPFSAAYMYHLPPVQNDSTPVPPTQHPDNRAQSYSVI
ncbi:hypothetical protein FRC04_008773 [Tulasnella sp. 424]|nr:hypothetical protein FRC04_008773 [Tulasnella sp. 424]KAG8980002.1 hypothetical protein FRC05_007445 [Tulasnella sp. 425]